MTEPRTCIMYKEWECNNEHLNPGHGEGSCLEMHYMIKGEKFPTCCKCDDVLKEGRCPRKHTSPYLKGKERS